MNILDASFIIMCFLILQVEGWQSEDNSTSFMLRLMTTDAYHDMCLLENQLPFFVIEELYNHAFVSYSEYPSFTLLTYH
jgi:hypothetical protein